MKRIATLDALKKIIAMTPGLYVRWSRGPKYDKRASRDYLTGGTHAGMSAVCVDPEWASDDKWLARRVVEYRFLKMKDPAITCYLYAGAEVGTDSDGYSSIATDAKCVAKLTEDLIERLVELRG